VAFGQVFEKRGQSFKIARSALSKVSFPWAGVAEEGYFLQAPHDSSFPRRAPNDVARDALIPFILAALPHGPSLHPQGASSPCSRARVTIEKACVVRAPVER
jgi:hypothetical protein